MEIHSNFLICFFSGFGPTSGSRLPSVERIKDGYGQGYPSTVDSHYATSNGGIPGSGSVTEQQPGVHTHNGRVPPTLGSTNFLNRPIANGKPSGPQIETINGRPSILAGRKTPSNGLDTGKIVDGTNIAGQPSSPPYGPTQESGSANGRTPSGKPTFSNIPDISTTDRVHQPARNGGGHYDSPTNNGYSNGKIQPNTGLQTIDQSRNGLTPIARQPTDVFGQPQGTTNENGAGGSPSTDVFAGLKNIFNLPPGLCLVRCDTLRPGQASLTPEQIRDAYIANGIGSQCKSSIVIINYVFAFVFLIKAVKVNQRNYSHLVQLFNQNSHTNQ